MLRYGFERFWVALALGRWLDVLFHESQDRLWYHDCRTAMGLPRRWLDHRFPCGGGLLGPLCHGDSAPSANRNGVFLWYISAIGVR